MVILWLMMVNRYLVNEKYYELMLMVVLNMNFIFHFIYGMSSFPVNWFNHQHYWLVVFTILKNMKVNGKDDIPYIMKWKVKNVTTNHIYIFDASYQPFMVIFGMVYHCVTNIATNHDLIMGWNSWNQTPGIRIHLQYRTRTMMGDVYVYRLI